MLRTTKRQIAHHSPKSFAIESEDKKNYFCCRDQELGTKPSHAAVASVSITITKTNKKSQLVNNSKIETTTSLRIHYRK